MSAPADQTWITAGTRVAALCAGYGGLELGLGMVWPGIETAWVAEVDRYASQVLDARFGVPNLGDLTQITNPPPVDIVTAGFPCQPVSTAGQQLGVDDERWIIDSVCRVASAAGARWLVLENVTGLLAANSGNAMARVCAAMAEAGFSRWEWTTVRASDIGACHRRERWFCVAHADDSRDKGFRTSAPEGRGIARPDDRVGGVIAHSDGQGSQRAQSAARRDLLDGRSQLVAHAEGDEQREPTKPGPVRPKSRDGVARFGSYQPAVDRWADVLGRPAPDPLTDGRLEPKFVEWMMGLPAGWVTDVINSRAKALHILGNGVVPQQAAAAIAELTQ